MVQRRQTTANDERLFQAHRGVSASGGNIHAKARWTGLRGEEPLAPSHGSPTLHDAMSPLRRYLLGPPSPPSPETAPNRSSVKNACAAWPTPNTCLRRDIASSGLLSCIAARPRQARLSRSARKPLQIRSFSQVKKFGRLSANGSVVQRLRSTWPVTRAHCARMPGCRCTHPWCARH